VKDTKRQTATEKAANDLYLRLNPYTIYTEKRAVITQVLLQLPGGKMMYDGSLWTPVVASIGAGVYKLSFKRD